MPTVPYPLRYLAIVAFLFSCDPPSRLPDPLQAGWKGKPVCVLVDENKTFRILRCTFPPGIGHEAHTHAPHTGYTIAGSRFLITDQDGTSRKVNVPTGTIFSKDTRTQHEVLNIGDSTAIFLIIESKED